MKFNKLLLILTAVTSIFVTNLTSPVVAQSVNTQVRESSDTDVQWTNDDFGDYYKEVFNSSSSTLSSRLSSLITSTHTTYTSYNGLKEVFNKADIDPNNSSNILCFYTGTSVKKLNDFGSGVNREHVWPKDGGDAFPEKSGPGSDGHHLRPTCTNLNSKRGSLSFGEVPQTPSNIVPEFGKTNYGSTADELCYIYDGKFYPAKGYRGQTARIIFYMASRWGGQYNLKIVEGSGSCKTIGDLPTLLKWNLEEPVSATELYRNEVVADMQGNRNPFIDNPHFACAIFGSNYDVCKDCKSVVNPYNGDVVLPDTPSSGGSSTPDTPTNPDTPTTPSTPGVGVQTSSISFDFNSVGIASTSYVSNKTVTIDNKQYYFSDMYVGDNGGTSVVRLGKKGSYAIQELGLSGSGSYLRPEFDLENCSSISLEIQKTYSNTKGYKILFKESNSSSYTTVKEGTLSGATTLEATLSTPKTGRFIIVITGSEARADLGQFTISTVSNSGDDTPSTPTNPTVDLSSLSLKGTVSGDKLKFLAEIDKTKLSSATKIGILVFSKNQLGTKEVKQLYTSGNLSSFKSSISKYDYLDFDFTQSKVEDNSKCYFTAVVSNVKGHEDYKFVAVAYAEIDGKLYFTSQISKSYNDVK